MRVDVTRRCLLTLVLAAGAAALGAAPSSGLDVHGHGRGSSERHAQPTVSIDGAVAAASTYSVPQLEALPQSTFTAPAGWWPGSRTHTDGGVSLEGLVNAAGPTLPVAKNALLRVTVTVSGRWDRRVTLALGELDSNFGDHPAYLALEEDGRPLPAPELVVPGDRDGARTVPAVGRITVGVQNPTPTTSPSPGALTIEEGPFTRVLSATQLAALPAETLHVSFLAGTAAQQHTEIGPTLSAVLRAAHLRAGLNTWVAAVGSDGYVATVTPGEAWVGGRPLLISLSEDGRALSQPRLVVDGDVKGGRYVSDVVEDVVGQGVAP